LNPGLFFLPNQFEIFTIPEIWQGKRICPIHREIIGTTAWVTPTVPGFPATLAASELGIIESIAKEIIKPRRKREYTINYTIARYG
jgi:hypothetical protein